MKNFQIFKLLVLIIFSVLLLSGCAGKSKSSRSIKEERQKDITAAQGAKTEASNAYGPQFPAAGTEKVETKAEEPIKPKSGKLKILVLGPGLLKTFAHIGVIKYLEKNDYSPDIVYATEFASIIAAFWGRYGINGAEWRIFKISEADLKDSGFFLNKSAIEGKKLTRFLSESFKEKSKARSRFMLLNNLSISGEEEVNVQMIQQDDVGALMEGLKMKGLFKLDRNKAALFTAPAPIIALKKKYEDSEIICVNVLSENKNQTTEEREDWLDSVFKLVNTNLMSEWNHCDKKVLVDTSNFYWLKMEKKAELIDEGFEAAQGQLKLE